MRALGIAHQAPQCVDMLAVLIGELLPKLVDLALKPFELLSEFRLAAFGSLTKRRERLGVARGFAFQTLELRLERD